MKIIRIVVTALILVSLQEFVLGAGAQVVSVVGTDAHILSSGGLRPAQNHAHVIAGDQLTTNTSSAVIKLNENVLVYVGPNSAVLMNDLDCGIELQNGELRIASRSGNGCQVTAMGYRLDLAALSVVRVAVDTALHVQCDFGGLSLEKLTNGAGDGLRVNVNERRTLDGSGAIAAEPYAWCIRPIAVLSGYPTPCPPLEDDETYRPDTEPVVDYVPTPYDSSSNSQAIASSTADQPSSTGNYARAQQLASSFNTNAGTNIGTGTGLAVAANPSNTDANQQSLNPAFPGAIHFVTGERAHSFSGQSFTVNELTAFSSREYWSIGQGPVPTSQVTTDAGTGTNPTPTVIPLPQADGNYLIRLDQFGAIDSILDASGAISAPIAITGLLGANPISPVVTGATPLGDDRAIVDGIDFNRNATFAFGEFRVDSDPSGAPRIAIRRSAQDRNIVKDPGGNDANDVVEPNPDVASFDDVVDARFLPQSPTVKVPTADAFDSGPAAFGRLDRIRRAAAITLTAEKMYDYAERTGQTRFVVDGRIIDISGYRR